MRITAVLLVGIFCAHTFSIGAVVGQEVQDITILTPFAQGTRPTVANFYFNDRAVGSGPQAFETIIKRVAELPAGTSIVWGPNYARCGSRSGIEPLCLPKHLYPDLWKQLQETITERKLTLSSAYPGPRIRATESSRLGSFPTEIFAETTPPKEKFADVVEFEIATKDRSRRESLSSSSLRWDGEILEMFDIDLRLGRLPEHSKMLVRLTFPEEPKGKLFNSATTDILRARADTIVRDWTNQLEGHLRRNRIDAVIVVPPVIAASLRENRDAFNISWQNYHGPETSVEEVIYLVNGIYVGRGNSGFDQILKQVEQLPRAANISFDQYFFGGRAAFENLGSEEVMRRNEKLKDLVPFLQRYSELANRIKSHQLLLRRKEIWLEGEGNTLLSWNSGDRYASKIASFGHIVRHDEVPKRDALKLGWTGYDASERRERKLETTARYTVDDQEVGQGIDGFAKAMQRIEALAEGSVVQVKVCLRTKGPFHCPLIYEGQRHCERTGYEPYFGLFDWLIDVAKQKRLQIEWLPDEAEKGCYDCELNR
jgi:hypothetical protein